MQYSYITSVLVPVDFTEKSVYAMRYAGELIRKNSGVIHALHVVDNIFHDEKNKEFAAKAKVNLTEYCQKYEKILDTRIIPMVVEGNIFNSIGKTAENIGAQIVVMGVHGVSGIQFLIGSFAVRVILGSRVPVILVNEAYEYNSFESIVLPFDPDVKMDFLVEKTLDLAKKYNSTIHLVSVLGDLSFFRKIAIMRKIENIITKIKKNGLKYRNVILQDNATNFNQKILEYATHTRAEPIMLSIKGENNGNNGFIPAAKTGKLIENPRVPLYIVNPS